MENDILQYCVMQQFNGLRIDVALSYLANISRSKSQALIAGEVILLNNIIVLKSKTIVYEGDIITAPSVVAAPIINNDLIPYDKEIRIVYEDEFLLVVDKDAGMCVHPGVGNLDNTLVNALLAQKIQLSTGFAKAFRPGIVHRLDKDTSGLLLVAKDDNVHAKLAADIKNKNVMRKYQAIVFGVPSKSSGTICTNIDRDKSHYTKRSVVKTGGKTAITHYNLLRVIHNGQMSLVECILDTGRTHQIRVHMSHMGHSVVGDPVYGKNTRKINNLTGVLLLETSIAKTFELLIPKRQALHSHYLQFMHPISNNVIECTSPLPADMLNLLEYQI